MNRADGRSYDQLREIKISYNAFGYAPGSVLFELGNTKVLCAVSLSQGVPHFLKGTKSGWLTAEYSMLPTAGQIRATREINQAKRNDRAIEISRLIGRSLRSIVDLSLLGERTIFVDCDVLQADGSTRTAAITGSYLALQMAVKNWLITNQINQSIIIDSVAAVSVGFAKNQPLLDLDYAEDSMIDADYNFVLTRSGNIIEIQGSAEKRTLSWDEFDQLRNLALKGHALLFEKMDQSLGIIVEKDTSNQHIQSNNRSVPLFSLKNRLENIV